MAAVLLLVAVVTGTWASGAQAEFDITNNCSKAVVITTDTDSYRLAPGGTLHVFVLPNRFFIPPVTITIKSIPPVIVPIGTISLDWLKQLGGRLHKIEIRCDGNCITLYVTYSPVLDPTTNNTISLGPFCP